MPPRRAGNTNTGDHEDPPPNLAQLMPILHQQSVTVAQQQQLLQKQLQQPLPPPPTPTTFKSFQAVKPPEFCGTQDPVEDQSWLNEMEKAFTLTVVREEIKVDYVSYFLKGEANYWWESARALEEGEVIPWDIFKKIFLEKYFPRYMQTQIELKFFDLKQEGMTVGEYEKKFTELARFVGDYVDTDEKRTKRFQQGLKPWLRSRVAAFELATYAEVVQKAMVIEGEKDQNSKEKDSKKRKFGSSGGGSAHGSQGGKNFKKFGFQNQGGPRSFKQGDNKSQRNRIQGPSGQRFQQAANLECNFCNKRHTGNCNKADKCNSKGHYANECRNPKPHVTCFNCGKTGHMSRDRKTPGNNKLMQLTAAPYNQAMTSYVPILQLASNQPSESATPVFPPSYPAQARTFNMNIKDAVQREFDVILGMDWLEEYSAQIDCKKKKVVLKSPQGKKVEIKGQKQVKAFFTLILAKRLLRQGCEGYLAHVIDRSKETPNIENIPIVSEFPDVFPDELPGFPNDRQIEFSIDLAPGVEPGILAEVKVFELIQRR
ncbi:uncharacterized protein LOC141680287 [Apium graveolens]|uniref:uncharacterized protein LOC141680287 n=1 Tax=Apium graveolens TaxID=4045 RepID=UPI003D7BE102